jgi:hypothetical protein
MDRYFTVAIVLYGFIPLTVNSALAVASFLIWPEVFKSQLWVCYVAFPASLGCAAVTIIGFVWHGFGAKKTLLAVFLHSFVLMVVFAGIYFGHGLLYDLKDAKTQLDRAGALYFSIVTWTTVGYGDFSPMRDIRLIAAFEALIGYLFFGVAVGLGTHLCLRVDLANNNPSTTSGTEGR